MRYIQAWLDHPVVGCGVRRFIDMTGPKQKQAVLFYVPTLTQIRVDFRELATAKPVELTPRELRHLRVLVKNKRREHKRLGLRLPSAQVEAVLAALDAEIGQ